jgi:hypothetical protein
VFSAGDDDLVECGVEFAVAAAVEPVADGFAGAGWDRCCSGGAREGGFVAEAALV